MAKAVAVRTLFLIVVIGLLLLFSLIVFWHWMDVQAISANRTVCTIKYQNYCARCLEKNSCPGDWNNVEPKTGCDQFGINEPDLETCKNQA